MTEPQAPTVMDQILAEDARPNPWPLYEELRKTPVARQPDGTYAVSGYDEIVALLHDPRMSSDTSKRPGGAMLDPAFINMDPPAHDSQRREATSFFGPPHRPDLVANLEPWMRETVNRIIDGFVDRKQIDVVEDYAYPFPVSAICRVLGVPPEDEPKFHDWSGALIVALSLRLHPEGHQKEIQAALTANQEMTDYLGALAEAHAKDPGDDILSGLATDKGPDAMDMDHIKTTARLLLVAGHETTVNLISNGTLTLLRHPEHIDRVVNDPEYVIRLVEELLRYEPPVQMVPSRTALEDIAVGETTIPAGSAVTLVHAAGNRDPRRFADPHTFDPDRQDGVEGQHLGLGGGVHYCFGAPLARLEVQIALRTLFSRLDNPRLVQDPPPYRPSPILRGPIHLPIEMDGVKPA